LIGYAKEQMAAHLGIEGSGSQIVPVVLGDSVRALRVAQQMQADGFDIRAIRTPTVPANTARLRIAVTLNVDPPTVSRMFKRLGHVMAQEQR
jgi:8-amino-7-oxononanoate synthase